MTLADLPMPFNGAAIRDRLNAALLEIRAARRFASVADLLADTTLAYGSGSRAVETDDVVEAEGYRYEVALIGSSTDTRVVTAGGVILTVLPGADGALSVKAFGALGADTDDTTYIKKAARAAAHLHFPAGTYLVSDTIVIPDALTRISCAPGATVRMTANKKLFYKQGSQITARLTASASTAGARYIDAVGVEAAGIGVDDWVILRANNATPNVTAGSQVAMLRRVTDTDADRVYIDAATYRDMTDPGTPTVTKVQLATKTVFEGGTYTSENVTTTALMEFTICEGPEFHGVTIRDLDGPAIAISYCVGGSWSDSHIRDLTDDSANGKFGYGIVFRGASRGFQVVSGSIGRCRHALTTATYVPSWTSAEANDMLPAMASDLEGLLNTHGEPEGILYGPIYCHATTNAALDTHEQGHDITIIPNVHGCFEGVHIRSGETHVMGGHIVGCRRNGVRIGGPASNGVTDGSGKIKVNITGTYIDRIAEDGTGGTESVGITMIYDNSELHAQNVSIVGFKEAGIKVTDNCRLIMQGGLIDGLSPGDQEGIRLETSNNSIDGVMIRNCFRGIREETGATGNRWTRMAWEGNTTNESRVPSYVPNNRHNSSPGAAPHLNDHEVPLGYFRSGKYYTNGGFATISTSSALGNGSMRFAPLWVRDRITIDRIACEVTGAGSAGALVRLGIYKDAIASGIPQGYPGDLLLDAGTVDATTTGAKEITISQVLEPGLYWVGGGFEGAPATPPTLRTVSSGSQVLGANSAAVALGTVGGFSISGSGGLPSTFTADQQPAGSGLRVAVRVA